MDDHCKLRSFDKGNVIEDKKFSLNPAKEEKIKRKLSTIQKEIGNLNYRKKLAQNQSAKAKKKIHNQISQIVKRLRAREQILLSKVDEAHASMDSNISVELLKLQSVFCSCQALLKNFTAFGGDAGIISSITSTLNEVNCREKSDFKPLTFISDFEEMKTRAETYGNLDGDFVKGGLIMNENGFYDSKDSDVKREFVDQDLAASNTNPGTSYCCLEKSSSEDSDIEETFQIINLIDDMHCIDLEDYVMEEEGIENSKQLKKKLDEEAYERESKVAKTCDNTETSQIINTKSINFNPDEEWKHIQELNKKLLEFKATSSKYNNLRERWSFMKENFHVSQEASKSKFNKKFQKDVPRKEKDAKNIDANIVSPADLIKKSFQSYQVKGDIKYWLASN